MKESVTNRIWGSVGVAEDVGRIVEVVLGGGLCRSALTGGAVESSLDAGVSRIPVLFGESGLALGVGRVGQRSLATFRHAWQRPRCHPWLILGRGVVLGRQGGVDTSNR